jgi:hypothetical protein
MLSGSTGKHIHCPAASGEWDAIVVPEECWFIRPDLNINNGGVAAADIADLLRRLAVVQNTDAWVALTSGGSLVRKGHNEPVRETRIR